MPYVNIRITRDGITREQKQRVVYETTRALQEILGKDPQHIHVIIDEVDTDNWGFAGMLTTDYRAQGILTMAAGPTIVLKRVYEPPAKSDGMRVLVERLWPRGLSKDKARVDLWMKDVAPSPELRRWYDHDPVKWAEFRKRYFAELREREEAVAALLDRLPEGPVTFVFASRETRMNSAAALTEYLGRRRK